MKLKIDKVFEKSNKISQVLWLLIIAVCYGIKSIYFFVNYIKEAPQLLKEFMNIDMPISKVGMIIGLISTTIFMAFIIKLIINFLFTSLMQRQFINGEVKSFASVFYLAYCISSILVAIFTNLGFLSPELSFVGSSIISFAVYTFFYYLAYMYINKTLIKPIIQAQAFKLISSVYLVYCFIVAAMDVIFYDKIFELVINVVLMALIGGAFLISNKIKIKLTEAENIAKEELKAKLANIAVEEKEKTEIFKGFGF